MHAPRRPYHQSVLVPAADGHFVTAATVDVDTSLRVSLEEVLPPAERAAWRPWISLVVVDLRRALRRPASAWNSGWVRWLLAIPIIVAVPGPARAFGPTRSAVMQLRRKLEAEPARPRYLRTEPGVGYRLLAK